MKAASPTSQHSPKSPSDSPKSYHDDDTGFSIEASKRIETAIKHQKTIHKRLDAIRAPGWWNDINSDPSWDIVKHVQSMQERRKHWEQVFSLKYRLRFPYLPDDGDPNYYVHLVYYLLKYIHRSWWLKIIMQGKRVCKGIRKIKKAIRTFVWQRDRDCLPVLEFWRSAEQTLRETTQQQMYKALQQRKDPLAKKEMSENFMYYVSDDLKVKSVHILYARRKIAFREKYWKYMKKLVALREECQKLKRSITYNKKILAGSIEHISMQENFRIKQLELKELADSVPLFIFSPQTVTVDDLIHVAFGKHKSSKVPNLESLPPPESLLPPTIGRLSSSRRSSSSCTLEESLILNSGRNTRRKSILDSSPPPTTSRDNITYNSSSRRSSSTRLLSDEPIKEINYSRRESILECLSNTAKIIQQPRTRRNSIRSSFSDNGQPVPSQDSLGLITNINRRKIRSASQLPNIKQL